MRGSNVPEPPSGELAVLAFNDLGKSEPLSRRLALGQAHRMGVAVFRIGQLRGRNTGCLGQGIPPVKAIGIVRDRRAGACVPLIDLERRIDEHVPAER
jgi:hypothetical protein